MALIALFQGDLVRIDHFSGPINIPLVKVLSYCDVHVVLEEDPVREVHVVPVEHDRKIVPVQVDLEGVFVVIRLVGDEDLVPLKELDEVKAFFGLL